MRLRDYSAFLQFTGEHHAIVVVCASNLSAGQWIGRAGTACYAGRLSVPTCEVGPQAGLLAAAPDDPRLQAALRAFGLPLSYSDYVARLLADGFRVLGAENGYVLEDQVGRRLYEGYRLHGVFDTKSYEPLWTGRRGENLRTALNRCLGSELVTCGPHDQWAHRNDQAIAGPWWGPQAPAIEFNNGKKIENLLSVRDLARSLPYGATWAELYPHHPLNKEP
jgi:hypothetical protein